MKNPFEIQKEKNLKAFDDRMAKARKGSYAGFVSAGMGEATRCLLDMAVEIERQNRAAK